MIIPTKRLMSLCMALAGCTSGGHGEALDPSRDISGVSAVLLGLRMAGDGAKGCHISFSDEEGELVGKLKAGGDEMKTLRVKIDPGHYEVVGPICGKREMSRLGERDPLAFDVYDDQVSYLGDLVFQVQEDGSWAFRYGDGERDGDGDSTASGTELHEVKEDDEDRPSDLRRLKSLPKSLRHEVVSGYTGKAVRPGKAKWTRAFSTARINTIAAAAGSTWAQVGKPIDLDECVAQERAKNPLTVGELKLTAYFRDNKFRKVEEGATTHAYSSAFVQCVKAEIKKHHCGVPGEIVYEIDL